MNFLIKLGMFLMLVCNPFWAKAQSPWSIPFQVINPTYIMNPGDTITTKNGRYYLVLQASDGNSVIYENGTGKVMWSNYTPGATMLAFQADGNFVAYKNGTAIWNSHTVQPYPMVNQMYFFDNGAIVTTLGGAATWSTDPAFLFALKNPGATGCTTAMPYPACVFPGTINQFNTIILACSVADAQRQAAATGAVYGSCH